MARRGEQLSLVEIVRAAPAASPASACLAQIFGHAGFRPGQQEPIDALLGGRDALVVLPTGGIYFARVKAVNVYGTSVASPEVSVTVATPSPKPGAPQTLNASFSGRTVGITWAAPLTGDPVTSYTLEVGTAPGLANIVVVPVGRAGPAQLLGPRLLERLLEELWDVAQASGIQVKTTAAPQYRRVALMRRRRPELAGGAAEDGVDERELRQGPRGIGEGLVY